MNANESNVGLIEVVASALGPLLNQFVFIGGSATCLLITDVSRPSVRATVDVDLLVEVSCKGDYYRLSEQLRNQGFRENSDLICRWTVRGILVDVMPTDGRVLGFANSWAARAVETAATVALPSGVQIRLITPSLFVATKIEAFLGRGDGNFRESHDLEDIVNLFDGRPELLKEIQASDPDVREYLEDEVGAMLGQADFLDSLHWHFGGDAISQARVPELIRRLRQVAGL